jgi:hypothetical protein
MGCDIMGVNNVRGYKTKETLGIGKLLASNTLIHVELGEITCLDRKRNPTGIFVGLLY